MIDTTVKYCIVDIKEYKLFKSRIKEMTTSTAPRSASKVRNQKASYWQYTGNHENGQDCSRNNPYGIPMGVIAWVASPENATYKNDAFGQTVTVTLPKDEWNKAYIGFAKHLGEVLLADWSISSVQNDDGVLWAINSYEEYAVELQERNPDETLLEAVKKGYAVIYINGKEYLFESASLSA
jgi:hypothetical protein